MLKRISSLRAPILVDETRMHFAENPQAIVLITIPDGICAERSTACNKLAGGCAGFRFAYSWAPFARRGPAHCVPKELGLTGGQERRRTGHRTASGGERIS